MEVPCARSGGLVVAALGVVLVLPPACGRVAEPAEQEATGLPGWFVEEARGRGLDFVHASGASGELWMPEIMGGGAALFDMDSDGDLDAYCVQSGTPGEASASALEGGANQLFENDGAGHFRDVSAERGAADGGYGNGVTVGDVDGDGDLDLFVTNLGPNALYENDGRGTFTDVTVARGLGHAGWGTSCAFVDFDLDGALDLFVCNYLDWDAERELPCYNTMGGSDYCNPRNYQAPAADVLYRNLGDGRFRDVSEELGIAARPGTGLGVVVADFNLDGWPDLFVANDGVPDRLWINQGGTGFVDRAAEFGCALDQNGRAAAGMGVVCGDVDRDGDPDLMVCNLRNEPDSFFRNEEGRAFANRTARVGLGSISRRFTRFGMGWYDFDQDGLVDLYQANGRVMRQRDELSDDPYAEPNLLFRGNAEGGFDEVDPRGGTAEPLVATSRAAAFGDVDGDGAVDVLIVNRDARAHLLLNRVPQRGSWVILDVRDAGPAFGARLEVRSGDVSRHHAVQAAESYQAASDARVHVGLGSQRSVDAVLVTWPDGSREEFGPLDVGAVHRLQRGSGSPR